MTATTSEMDRHWTWLFLAWLTADARALNVTKTPGFFVNGKPLVNFGAEQLKAMVADALRSAP